MSTFGCISRQWLEVRKFDAFRPYSQNRFIIFCSPDPRSRSLCGEQRSLRQAVLSASGASRPWTNFKCRPVDRYEKRAALEKITAPELPYLGAHWVIERDQGAIAQYEQEYEQHVASYRSAQSPGVSRREASSSSGGTVMEEDPWKPERAEDPITKQDRWNWVEYLLNGSTDVEEAEEVLLKDFMSEYGANRNWAFGQWLIYLKNNQADIRRLIAKVQKSRMA